MKLMMKEITLPAIFEAVCQCHDSRFEEKLQRLSNNNCPKFSDKEIISIYLWGKAQQLPTRKAIYRLVKQTMLDKFPALPSYQAFCRRLNWLAPAFQALAEIWREQYAAKTEDSHTYLLDSCPIILAKGRRSKHGKVARDLCSQCYNSARQEWYYGVKLHVLGSRRVGKLPVPCSMNVTTATLCDLWSAKQIMLDNQPIHDGVLYADRAYIDADWSQTLQQNYNIQLLTPKKKRKDEVFISRDAYSSFVSGKRQPIESFFHWMNVVTGIQNASHIRSSSGLLFHIFSSLALALFHLNS